MKHRPDTPPPGSDAAVTRGCLCPRIDNARGRGYVRTGENGWLCVMVEECPLHGLGGKKRRAMSDDRQ